MKNKFLIKLAICLFLTLGVGISVVYNIVIAEPEIGAMPTINYNC